MPTPRRSRACLRGAGKRIGERLHSAHFHDTRGTGLANVVAALDVGIRSFDSSLGGLGGCPHAPGASGNIATEDLVFMLEAMGFETGIDLEALIKTQHRLAELAAGAAALRQAWRCRRSEEFFERAAGRRMTTSAASARPTACRSSGVRVVEFSQMVMGPCCGFILAELGAEVIKVEPLPRGDHTRYLPGLAAGFFTAFNRNKKSIALDIDATRAGSSCAQELIATADVMLENFRPGMMGDMGLDYASVARLNERLVYCSLKGFLPGPYEKRTALDEIVQMMGGLAFMTGPAGQADARRRVGERHHGRDVRRHRHSGCPARARDAPAAARRFRRRCSRTTCS